MPGHRVLLGTALRSWAGALQEAGLVRGIVLSQKRISKAEGNWKQPHDEYQMLLSPAAAAGGPADGAPPSSCSRGEGLGPASSPPWIPWAGSFLQPLPGFTEGPAASEAPSRRAQADRRQAPYLSPEELARSYRLTEPPAPEAGPPADWIGHLWWHQRALLLASYTSTAPTRSGDQHEAPLKSKPAPPPPPPCPRLAGQREGVAQGETCPLQDVRPGGRRRWGWTLRSLEGRHAGSVRQSHQRPVRTVRLRAFS